MRTEAAAAFEALYLRHVDAARTRARYLARNPIDADDLVSEGFAQVLAVLQSGKGGPTRSFRGYLLTTITHAALALHRRDSRLVLTSDPGTTADDARHAEQRSHQESAVENALDRLLAARAFRSLPSRTQQLLWYTEVVGASPAALARALRTSPNAVSARAHRARESLRTAYLDAHVAGACGADACTPFVRDLAAFIRNALGPRRRHSVQDHLTRCPLCRDLSETLTSINTTPRQIHTLGDATNASAATTSGPHE
ncbi:sigma-70 family RNA polymerase sigma factor [Lentzea alba]|uniref:sigma-70 family RNA polymerase sigma factor n=1 Tax=Lentzea alba TaxID=2714351 RepID=UPI0039BF39F5